MIVFKQIYCFDSMDDDGELVFSKDCVVNLDDIG